MLSEADTRLIMGAVDWREHTRSVLSPGIRIATAHHELFVYSVQFPNYQECRFQLHTSYI